MRYLTNWLVTSLLHIALLGACITAALVLWALHDDALVARSVGVAFVLGPTLGAFLVWGLDRHERAAGGT